ETVGAGGPGFPGKGPAGRQMVFVVNGDQGWLKLGGPVMPLQGDKLREMKNNVFALGLSNLHSLQDKEYGVFFVEESLVRGRPTHKIRVSAPGQPEVLLYFDRETKLLGKSEIKGSPLREIYLSDYQESDGIRHWRRAEQYQNGDRYGELEVRSVRFFDHLDESLF